MRLLIFLYLLSSFLLAQDLFIISNSKFPLQKLNEKQIKKIFLKKIDYIHSIPIYPVNLSSNHTVRELFRERVLHMTTKEIKQYWTRAHYKGKRAPITQNSIQSIIKFIQEIDGSISYIYTKETPKNVKILYKMSIQ